MPLTPPQSWRDELARALEPEAFAAGSPAPFTLQLSFFEALRDGLAAQGITLPDVAADIESGFAGGWRQGAGDRYYRLSSGRFDVYLSQREERDSRTPIAIVTSVKPTARLARRDGLARAYVTFHPPWDAAYCDIDSVDRARACSVTPPIAASRRRSGQGAR